MVRAPSPAFPPVPSAPPTAGATTSGPALQLPVTLPLGGARKVSHEKMWRDDALYDLVLVIDHNQRPRIAGRGSAVFVHLARPGFKATEGCVALRRADMTRLLARLKPGAVIDIA